MLSQRMKDHQDNPYEAPNTVSKPTSVPVVSSNTWRLGAWLGFFAGLAPVIGYYAVFIFGWLTGGRLEYLRNVLGLAPVAILLAITGAAIGALLGLIYDMFRRTFF